MAGHIRAVLQAKDPENWEALISEPFTEEAWEQVRRHVRSLHATGMLSHGLTDEADLLDVNHFLNHFQKHFDDLFPPGASGETPRDHDDLRRNVEHWARTVKALRDPNNHFRPLDLEDASLMLDSVRRILSFIDPDAASQVLKYQKQIWNPSEEVLEPRWLENHTLPSRETIAPSFVGREKELKVLKDTWLRDPQSHRVRYLVGDGGKGKTALAYRFAEEVINQPPEGLELVIWLSAKVRRFDEAVGQTTNIENPDFWDLNSALDWILWAYGAPDFQKMSLDDKIRVGLEYLQELPALVVVDDVDSLEGEAEDLALEFFTRQTEGTPSKFLLTSRRMSFGTRRISTQVGGFERNEGRDFVRSRVELYGLDPNLFPTGVIDQILDTCDSSPLYVQDLLRRCGVGLPPA